MPVKKRITGKKPVKHNARWYHEAFIANEDKRFKIMIGRYIASGFSGFIAGLVVGAIVFYVVVQAVYGG